MRRRAAALLARLKSPTLSLSLFSYLVTVAAVAFALVALFYELGGIVSYVAYAAAALTLGYSVYITVRFAPAIRRGIVARVMRISLFERLASQYGFRTLFFAGISLSFNVAYAVFNAVVAALSSSLFYGALAAYYILLTLMRGAMVYLHKSGGSERAELIGFRSVGVLLSIMPLALSAVVLEMISSEKGYSYGELLIYAVAAYTFWKLTMAIINVVRVRRSARLTVRAVRDIALADASVSVLALQTAMLRAFSDGGLDASLINALTGAGVCAVTLAIGVVMIVYSFKQKNDLGGASVKTDSSPH